MSSRTSSDGDAQDPRETIKREAEAIFGISIGTRLRNPLLRAAVRLFCRMAERLLGLSALRRHYVALRCHPRPGALPQQILLHMHTKTYYTADDLRRIPARGALLITANHPFGAIEGLAVLELVRRQRPDVKVLANALLARIPELRQDMFFVDLFGASLATQHNSHALRQSLAWLNEGHALIVFPAGEVASFAPRAFRIRDPEWHASMMTLVRHCTRGELAIMPLFVPGRASLLFHLLGKIHPRLRTLMLPREMLRARKRTLTLRTGTPIAAAALFTRFAKDSDAMRYVRYRTYLLASRERSSKFSESMRQLTFDLADPTLETLIAPVPPDVILKELSDTDRSTCLLNDGRYRVYVARGTAIPETLREIGRLRELTFRAAGEGTGRALDADEFDGIYFQLILWNIGKQEIIGSYRLGLSDELVETYGLRALYTRTLFRFDERFLGYLPGPAVELGRSFVRPEYQRAFAPLLLLWRGVLTFVALRPRYTVLFGPVSISQDFYPASRSLLIDYIRTSHYDAALAHWVSARLPPKTPPFAEWRHPDYADFRRTEADIGEAIAEIEGGAREMPVLIRQYLRLGGRVCAFNVDPDFGTVVDGLIVVNLLRVPERDMRRYMGPERYAAYKNTSRNPNT